MKTENGFKILASFSGISQVGCRKSLFWSFLRSLDTLHVVGPTWRGGRMGGSHFIDIEGEEKARNHFRGLVFELKAPRRCCSAHFYAWEPCQLQFAKHLERSFHPRNKVSQNICTACLLVHSSSWLFTREFSLPIHDHTAGFRSKIESSPIFI